MNVLLVVYQEKHPVIRTEGPNRQQKVWRWEKRKRKNVFVCLSGMCPFQWATYDRTTASPVVCLVERMCTYVSPAHSYVSVDGNISNPDKQITG